MGKWRLDPGQIEVVDDAMAEVLRAKQPWERVAMVGQANRTVRHLLAGGIRFRHPNWTDEQVRREVARRMLGGPG
jgi:hypothetical protein